MTTQASDPTATPENRRIMGPADPYRPVRLDGERLNRDMAYRRSVAWKIVHNTLAPVPLRGNVNLSAYEDDKGTIPRWLTWYDGYEFTELFDMLYGADDFGKSQGKSADKARADRSPFAKKDLEEVFERHSRKDLLGWTEERFLHKIGKLKVLQELQGLTKGHEGIPAERGMGMTIFSPTLMKHLLANYKNVFDCVETIPNIKTETEPNSEDNFSICLGEEFPGARPGDEGTAIGIKATWQKTRNTDGSVDPVAVYKHDPERFKEVLQSGEWTNETGTVPPNPDSMFTIKIPGGKTYVMTGFHIMAKQTRHWIWITLWWAPDADQDFGADRPKAIETLGRNLDQYKMCVTTGFQEEDPTPWKKYLNMPPRQDLTKDENRQRRKRLKTLAATLKAGHEVGLAEARKAGMTLAPTWCSNPFVEMGKGNANTNCIGCHQHGGSYVGADSTFSDEESFPLHGRTLVRKNFPSDYLWSFDIPPDDFMGRIDERISWYEYE